jgi:hypothetical protein
VAERSHARHDRLAIIVCHQTVGPRCRARTLGRSLRLRMSARQRKVDGLRSRARATMIATIGMTRRLG